MMAVCETRRRVYQEGAEPGAYLGSGNSTVVHGFMRCSISSGVGRCSAKDLGEKVAYFVHVRGREGAEAGVERCGTACGNPRTEVR